jgi:hypothetical protein
MEGLRKYPSFPFCNYYKFEIFAVYMEHQIMKNRIGFF